jgi:hypothetical protein
MWRHAWRVAIMFEFSWLDTPCHGLTCDSMGNDPTCTPPERSQPLDHRVIVWNQFPQHHFPSLPIIPLCLPPVLRPTPEAGLSLLLGL